jgi:hypothetical protein
MGDGSTKQRHKPIAQKLINGPFVPMDLTEGEFEEPIQQGMHVLWTKTFGNGSRVRQVTEQYCHLFSFAFEGTPGDQNFLGKVFGCVGQWFAFVV